MLYATPTVALGSGVFVTITRGTTAGAMVKANVFDVVCGVEQESATCTTGLKPPDAVGVPESNPLDAKLRPVGNAPPVRVHV